MLPKSRLTPEEYLEIERKAEYKSEYYQGEMFAMAGASLDHNQLVANLVMLFGMQLRGKACRVLPSDVRVCVSATGLYTYPDAVILCGDPIRLGADRDTLPPCDMWMCAISTRCARPAAKSRMQASTNMIGMR